MPLRILRCSAGTQWGLATQGWLRLRARPCGLDQLSVGSPAGTHSQSDCLTLFLPLVPARGSRRPLLRVNSSLGAQSRIALHLQCNALGERLVAPSLLSEQAIAGPGRLRTAPLRPLVVSLDNSRSSVPLRVGTALTRLSLAAFVVATLTPHWCQAPLAALRCPRARTCQGDPEGGYVPHPGRCSPAPTSLGTVRSPLNFVEGLGLQVQGQGGREKGFDFRLRLIALGVGAPTPARSRCGLAWLRRAPLRGPALRTACAR